MIKVILAEDQAMLCDSLKRAINEQPDMQVLSTYADAAEVPNAPECAEADLLLLDVCTKHDNSGILAAGRAKGLYPNIKTIVMTGIPEVTFIPQARRAHADSFVYKDIGTEELLGIIRSTAQGYSTYPRHPQTESVFDALTEEEVHIVRLVCEMHTRSEIAHEMLMSEATVKRRISEILAKTGFDSIQRLALHAVSNGYIAPNLDRN